MKRKKRLVTILCILSLLITSFVIPGNTAFADDEQTGGTPAGQQQTGETWDPISIFKIRQGCWRCSEAQCCNP